MAYTYDDDGNRKRTVRCSYCYEVGHTKRTCRYLHPDGSPAQQRKKAEMEAKAERKRLGVKAERKCTYCGETGHQRRKCKVLKRDKQRLASAIYEYRYAVSEYVNEHGLGEGALLTANTSRWCPDQCDWVSRPAFFMVLGLDYTKLDPHHNWKITKREKNVYADSNPMTLMSLSADTYALGETTSTLMMTYTNQNATKLTDLVYRKYNQGTQTNTLRVACKGRTNIPTNYLNHSIIRSEVDDYFKSTKTKEHYQFLTRLDHLDEVSD